MLQETGNQEIGSKEEASVNKRINHILSKLITPELANRLEYTKHEFEPLSPEAEPRLVQGLTTKQSQLLLTEIMEQFISLSNTELASLFTPLNLTPTQGHAAAYAAYWILHCLEWESYDQNICDEYSLDKKNRMITSHIRTLENFRRTGEP